MRALQGPQITIKSCVLQELNYLWKAIKLLSIEVKSILLKEKRITKLYFSVASTLGLACVVGTIDCTHLVSSTLMSLKLIQSQRFHLFILGQWPSEVIPKCERYSYNSPP